MPIAADMLPPPAPGASRGSKPCNRCGEAIDWVKDGGRNVPVIPGTLDRHWDTCKGAKRKAIIVFDFETLGTDPDMHDPVQIGAVALAHPTLEQLSTFSSYIQPLRPENAAPEALKLLDDNGLDLDFLAGCPDPDSARRQFQAWLDQFLRHPMAVGYNLDFDRGFMDVWAPGIEWSYARVDVLHLVRTALGVPGHIPNAKIETAAEYLGITIDAHDALSDALATAEIFRRFALAWAQVMEAKQP